METELAIKLQDSGVRYQTQVEIPITTVDFYFPTEPRPLLVFVDGRVYLGKTQMIKDEELRSLLRKKGYRVLELSYSHYSDKKRDELYRQVLPISEENKKDNNDVAMNSSSRTLCLLGLDDSFSLFFQLTNP